MTDDQFLNYCKYFDVGIFEKTCMIVDTQPDTSWYIPLNFPLNKPTQKLSTHFFEIGLFLDTDANKCILNNQACNAITTYLTPSKDELRQYVDEKVRTAKSQLLPNEGFVTPTLLPFRDHHATLTITLAIADTKYNNFGFPFLQTYLETTDTEHS